MDYYIKGTKISLTRPENVVRLIEKHDFKSNKYLSLFGLYVLSESFRNEKLQLALNKSWLNPVHGKSIEIYLRLMKDANVKTVDGVYLLDILLNKNLTHYFYGTTDKTLTLMKNKIDNKYPNAKVLGYREPPFVEINDIENNNLLKNDFKEIDELKPNIIWIGLGGVKQDLVMYNYSQYCQNSLMFGVGAVFDYFAGNLSLSPEWVKSIGLRWLYRGIIQPTTFKKIFRTAKNVVLH